MGRTVSILAAVVAVGEGGFPPLPVALEGRSRLGLAGGYGWPWP
ncbi:MAG: hypothetical protein ACKO21_10310 [Nodosilinea sp.]